MRYGKASVRAVRAAKAAATSGEGGGEEEEEEEAEEEEEEEDFAAASWWSARSRPFSSIPASAAIFTRAGQGRPRRCLRTMRFKEAVVPVSEAMDPASYAAPKGFLVCQ